MAFGRTRHSILRMVPGTFSLKHALFINGRQCTTHMKATRIRQKLQE